jgi:hypothetical protein
MRVDRTTLVHAGATDVVRYLCDPRQVLGGWPSMDYQLTPADPAAPDTQRYRVSSRTTRAAWIVAVRTLSSGLSVEVAFGREGEPPQGRFRYDLEPVGSGTSMRCVGEVRMSPVVRLMNALLRRSLNAPDPSLDTRVAHWLAANPDPRP